MTCQKLEPELQRESFSWYPPCTHTGTGCDYESWLVLITVPKSVASSHLQGEAPKFPQQPLQQPFRCDFQCAIAGCEAQCTRADVGHRHHKCRRHRHLWVQLQQASRVQANHLYRQCSSGPAIHRCRASTKPLWGRWSLTSGWTTWGNTAAKSYHSWRTMARRPNSQRYLAGMKIGAGLGRAGCRIWWSGWAYWQTTHPTWTWTHTSYPDITIDTPSHQGETSCEDRYASGHRQLHIFNPLCKGNPSARVARGRVARGTFRRCRPGVLPILLLGWTWPYSSWSLLTFWTREMWRGQM